MERLELLEPPSKTAMMDAIIRAMWHSIPLTSFWFVYFGSLGIFFPYFSLYLRENAGLSGTQVGLVLAISPLVAMIAQPIWGQIADRTGARTRTLAFLTVGTAFGYLMLGMAAGFWPIVLATALLALVGTGDFPDDDLGQHGDSARCGPARIRAGARLGNRRLFYSSYSYFLGRCKIFRRRSSTARQRPAFHSPDSG